MKTDGAEADTSPAALAALAARSRAKLRELWREVHGGPAPPDLSSGQLARALAYRRQAALSRDLSPRLQREMRTLARAEKPGMRRRPAAHTFMPGTRLVRVWRGDLYEVTVVDGGFMWNGKRYSSLTRLAREITGTHWNGMAFFGARAAPPRPRRATAQT